METLNPYEAPQGEASLLERSTTNMDRVRHGALTVCWASLTLVLLHLAVPLFTKLGWRSVTEYAVRNFFRVAAILWLCYGIRQLRAVSIESQARHLLSMSLLSWIVSMVIGAVICLQILFDVWLLPIRASLFGDVSQFLGKLTLLWAVSRLGRYYQSRQVTAGAGMAMLMLTLTDLPYVVGDLLAFVFSWPSAELEVMQAQLKLLDVPVHWMLYLLMQSAALYSLYALGTLANALQRSEQPHETASWKQDFQFLFESSRFQWGLSFCWWATLLAIVIPLCSQVIVLLKTHDWLSFVFLREWSDRAGILCQLIGMGLLWTIHSERAKPWFAWGAILLFAYVSFHFMKFFNGQEMELDTPSGKNVVLIVSLLPIISLWFHFKGFSELAGDWQDPAMQRRARQSLLRYSLLGAVWLFDLLMFQYAIEFIYEFHEKYGTMFYGIIILVHKSLEILVLISYIPLLTITCRLAAQREEEIARLPHAEPAVDAANVETDIL